MLIHAAPTAFIHLAFAPADPLNTNVSPIFTGTLRQYERPGTNFNWAVPAGGYLGNGQFNNNSPFYKSSLAVFNWYTLLAQPSGRGSRPRSSTTWKGKSWIASCCRWQCGSVFFFSFFFFFAYVVSFYPYRPSWYFELPWVMYSLGHVS